LRDDRVLDIEELIELSLRDIGSKGAIPPKLSGSSKGNEFSSLVFLEELNGRKETGDGRRGNHCS
jgi:hypothetical protein